MRRVSVVLGAVGVVAGGLLVGGCGQQEPVGSGKGFDQVAAGDARVLQVYRQSGTSTVRTVRLPARTAHVRVRVDCIGTGMVDVHVVGGVAGVPCGEASQPRGFIGIGTGRLVQDATQRVRITAPRGSRWSVAVDAGPGPVR